MMLDLTPVLAPAFWLLVAILVVTVATIATSTCARR
jgi:hypothetical protein